MQVLVTTLSPASYELVCEQCAMRQKDKLLHEKKNKLWKIFYMPTIYFIKQCDNISQQQSVKICARPIIDNSSSVQIVIIKLT